MVSGRGNIREGSVRVGFFMRSGGETVRGENVQVGFFSRRGLSGREQSGGELSMRGSCSGGTVRGKIVRGEFTGHHPMPCFIVVFL